MLGLPKKQVFHLTRMVT